MVAVSCALTALKHTERPYFCINLYGSNWVNSCFITSFVYLRFVIDKASKLHITNGYTGNIFFDIRKRRMINFTVWDVIGNKGTNPHLIYKWFITYKCNTCNLFLTNQTTYIG